MRKLLGVFSLSSLCLALAMGTVGCSGKATKFKAEKGDPATITEKDGTAEITFNKDVKTVEEIEGLKFEKKEKKVTFKWTADLPAQDKVLEPKVAVGDGKDDSVKVKITVKAKKGDTPAPKDEPKDVTLESETLSITLVKEDEAKSSVAIKTGKADVEAVKDAAGKEDAKGVKAKIAEGKLWVIVAKDAAVADYWVILKSTEAEKKGAKLKVTVLAAGTAPPKAEAHDVKLEKEELTIHLVKDGKATASVKIEAGKAEVDHVKNSEKKDTKAVSAKIEDGKLWVIVESNTAVGDYWVHVKSTEEGKKGAKLKVTVKAIAP
jgi:hypothetical protein